MAHIRCPPRQGDKHAAGRHRGATWRLLVGRLRVHGLDGGAAGRQALGGVLRLHPDCGAETSKES
eukprot:4922258-Alexandrium_andersonii.AAC.1